MTTSVFNQRRRRKRRAERDLDRRLMRRRGGDWKFDSRWRPRPNAQNDREDQGKDKR